MEKQIFDTHIHVWNFDRAKYSWLDCDKSILNRSYHLRELDTARLKAGITGGILVQAANNFEDTDWMLELASDNDWIKGVVGWLPLMDPESTEKALTANYSKSKYFKGVRHLIHDEPDSKWLLQPEVIESLGVLAKYQVPFDVVGILTEHIETALKVSEKIPGLKMVFDHMNQPPIASKQKFGRWGELMKEVSGNDKFFVKISGLGTTSQRNEWGADDIQPYVEFVLEWFGVDRCFCGGDWPVSLLAGSYTYTWNIYKTVLESLLKEHQQPKVMYGNAAGFYNI
jgi:L-fuconolactonase